MINVEVIDDISMTVMSPDGLPDFNMITYFIVPSNWHEYEDVPDDTQFLLAMKGGLIGRAYATKNNVEIANYQLGAYTLENNPLNNTDPWMVAQEYLEKAIVESKKLPTSVALLNNPSIVPFEFFFGPMLETYLHQLQERNPESIKDLEKEVAKQIKQEYNPLTRTGWGHRLLGTEFSKIFSQDKTILDMGKNATNPFPTLVRYSF